ncbi:TetR family transcriptional regulator [Microbispora sp. ATCC PTA-5024]|uniref:TetR family transcriptional regulator n=1 Tax=Microbispora sp. ATCC PTA-5024 TaxID=316330 RepID=UPI0003DDEBA2|nr:TetR family transcriptional regulator [Microbispora sp. ATCC PTA-5024]ETK33886.1 hypothetical protein MPTA5024_22270 [Microbispora sp. ATCC PTA-5024]
MGLRERKKHRTRTALIDAAVDLFLAQGYEATTVDRIAAEVDVSTRTFFRYFASKEEAALSLLADQHEVFIAELAARPADEPPFTALTEAMRAVLGILRALDPAEATRFLRLQELIQATPALLAGQLRLMMDNERQMVAEVSRRMGAGPDDLRARFVVSLFASMGIVCYGGCKDPRLIVQRFEDLLDMAAASLRPGWDRLEPAASGTLEAAATVPRPSPAT